MSDYENHLLSYLDGSKIMTLSCGHVIPTSSLLAVPVVQTSQGNEFDFTFEKRNSKSMVRYPACRYSDRLIEVDDRSRTYHLESCSTCP